jgi:hypothetical protein
MELLFKGNGLLDNSYRPIIDQQNSTRTWQLYNPNVPYNYGLYDGPQPYRETLQQNFLTDNPSPYPARTVTDNCKVVPSQSTAQIIHGYFPALDLSRQ